MKVNIFWFRRDLRLEDNTALNAALSSDLPVMPVFIFDTNIVDELPRNDARISFIYDNLTAINSSLISTGSSILIMNGNPLEKWKELTDLIDINAVYINKDYEPYAIHRDNSVGEFLQRKGIRLLRYRDQVIFEEDQIIKSDNRPYTVFTPYKNSWMRRLREDISCLEPVKTGKDNNYFRFSHRFPSIEETGFSRSNIAVRPFDLSVIPDYNKYRDLPAMERTSYISPHLRFGTVSIRKVVNVAFNQNNSFLNELIWREFFMQILFHFPHVVTNNFKPVYDDIKWRNDEKEFKRWCSGETGYPMVDAGMRQLNETGFMHNRVRMITAGFLCKHLLTDWRWGESYFAGKLLDYELSSNNGNWQWAAGTGCDAVPWFRIFNPDLQEKKFDNRKEFIRKWIPEYGKTSYPGKIVDHVLARERAVQTYRSGLKRKMK